MNPDKRKIVDSSLRIADLDPVRRLKVGAKTDSMKHRMDEAESLVRQMAEIMCRLLINLPEFKDDDFLRSHWFAKFSLDSAKRVMKKAEALLCARGRGEGTR